MVPSEQQHEKARMIDEVLGKSKWSLSCGLLQLLVLKFCKERGRQASCRFLFEVEQGNQPSHVI